MTPPLVYASIAFLALLGLFFGAHFLAARPRLLLSYYTLHLVGFFLSNVFGAIGTAVEGAWYETVTDAQVLAYTFFAGLYLVVFHAVYLAASRLRAAPQAPAYRLNLWEDGVTKLATVGLVLLGAGWALAYLPRLPYLAPITYFIANSLVIIGFGLIYGAWVKERLNLAVLALVGLAAFAAMTAGTTGTFSRRPVFGVLLVVAAVETVWFFARRQSVAAGLAKAAVLLGLGVVILAAYSSVRAGLIYENSELYGRDKVTTMLSAVGEVRGENLLTLLGDNSYAVGLLAIHMAENEGYSDFGFSFKVLAVSPIPRLYWPEKPEQLGHIIARDYGMWQYGYVNWGPSMVGHAYYDGSGFFVIVYAAFLGFFLGRFDRAIAASNYDLVKLFFLAQAGPHVALLYRGDMVGVIVLLIIIKAWQGVFEAGLRVFAGARPAWPGRLRPAPPAPAPGPVLRP